MCGPISRVAKGRGPMVRGEVERQLAGRHVSRVLADALGEDHAPAGPERRVALA